MNTSSKPIAGTYVLSGIIQGKVIIEPDFLEIWTKEAEKKGLYFSLRIDANDFSLLPTETPKLVSKLGETVLEDVVCERVESLMSLFDAPREAQIFSTLRSEEFKFGKSQQTIYKISGNGHVEAESRVVEVKTEDPPPELTTKGKIKLGIITLGVLALAFFASIPFVDYKAMFENAKDKVTTLKADELDIDTEKLNKAVTISVKEVIPKDHLIVLIVKKGDRWNTLYSTDPQSKFKSWQDFNVAQALHNRLRCEWYDKHGNLLLVNYIDVHELDTKETLEKKMFTKTKGKISSLRLLPD